jgi:hypothetical protein
MLKISELSLVLKFLRQSRKTSHEYSDELKREYETYLDNFIDNQYALNEDLKDYLEPFAQEISVSQKNYSLIQSQYLSKEYKLIPNRRIYADEKFFFQINSWGLKGGAPKTTGKKFVVWGDSVIFGFGSTWTDLSNESRYQCFSGGLEGANAVKIIDFAIEKNQTYQIDVNLISLGWHSLGLSRETQKYLDRTKILPNRAFLTLPYSIPLQLAARNLTNEFTSHTDVDSAFLFWGNYIYSPKACFKQIHEMQIQNEQIRKYAKRNSLPLLDLEKIFSSKASKVIDKKRFFDIGHPRPSTYPFLKKNLLNFIHENFKSW